MSAEPALKLHNAEPLAPIIPAAAPTGDAGPAKQLIRLRVLFARLDVSKPTGHRLLAAGKIGPRPIRLTSASVRFDVDEVDAWLKSRRPDGSLHDAKSWPPVWAMLQKKFGT